LINHYVNLICWREVLDLYDRQRDIIWIDSVSLRFLVFIFGGKIPFRPGTSVLFSYKNHSMRNLNWFFLTSKNLYYLSERHQYVLPYYRHKIWVPEDLENQISILPYNSNVAIGISSPKQNLLACELFKINAALNIHCLGAAVDQHHDENNKKKSLFIGSGFQWLSFLFSSPKRTISKLRLTIFEIYLICFCSITRASFKKFLKIIEKN